jgi:hypothetical protein
MTTPILSLILFCAGAVCYCISQLILQGKFKWDHLPSERVFWGHGGWMGKYKRNFEPAPTTWYYKLFDIKYKERFPGSATVFVALTDGYHLCQLLFLLLISGAIAVHTENLILWLLIYRCTFGVIFTIGYKLFAK